MVELHLQIPDDVAERLAAEAAERKMAPDDVVAELIERNILVRRHLRFVGVGRSGQHNNAARTEEILRERFAK